MKIKEAIEIINGTTSTVSAKESNDFLQISSENTAIYGDWFLKMPMNATNWESIRKEWGSLSPNIRPEDLALVMDIVQRLIDTPTKERFPEKKYRLRWINDQNHYKNYLNLNGAWVFVDDEIDADTFTESELEQLKKDNPHLAPAIDAMKEPAEDKDD
ncbi:hypothetical protein H5R88_07760 [Limosilactobacillus sp. WF-MT5-A]|uniref:hypothetical protein n=1 Tax=Limosilactobacillus agrestis TaxID=2759748 RepID=UPI0015F7F214|nr:hypothetical protein [Limosilactobacillus agrestis]MBB1099991.1 hypothetical protein [Limosilactobacillus agrestis]MCD7127391.1 hypothetical protein [Limosilactobacillus agrestis]